jgi:hypothetical protein
MQQLNLPHYEFKLKMMEEKPYIFDLIRRKYIKLTPEEWVRQNFIQFLITEKNYPLSKIALEQEIIINGLKKRCDAVVYSSDVRPLMIIEFKAPEIKINQQVFDQIAVYNYKLNVRYLIVSNGIQHIACKTEPLTSSYIFLKELPTYNDLNS